MHDNFKNLFYKQPIEIIDGDYYFNSDKDGDQFDENDAAFWFKGGIFKNNWESAGQSYFYNEVINTFSKKPSPFIEIACGPGMGLAPVILSKYPQTPCLATDACSLLIKSWRKFINGNLKQYNINMASFSALSIPIKSNSIDIVTSMIGISSTRAGEQGKIQALKEVYRILNNNGYFIAVENEWTDFNSIEQVFKLWGKPVWTGMQEKKSWQEKFNECGFVVESCDKTLIRKLSKDDNDLGEQADKFGIDIGMKFTLFVLRKFV